VPPPRLGGQTTSGRLALVASRLTPTNDALLEALRVAGVDAVWLSAGELAGDVSPPGYTLLGRIDVQPGLDGVEPAVWDLRRAERRGTPVLNRSETLLAAHDKLTTALRLREAELPHPRTALIAGADEPSRLRWPFVVKPRFGSWGRDVVLCERREDLRRCLAEFDRRPWFRRHGALVQELVPPLGHDLRLIVAGGRVVGGVRRRCAPGEWRTNVALGARREPLAEIPPAAGALAQAAAAALDADLVGVDLLPQADGSYVVLEVNGAADFTRDYDLSGDVFAAAAARLRACLGGFGATRAVQTATA